MQNVQGTRVALTYQELHQLEDEVISKLGRGSDRDDLIFNLCRQSGMSWPEAEAFVGRVERLKSKPIQKRRGFLFLFISLGIFLQGVGSAFPLFSLLAPQVLNMALNFDTLQFVQISALLATHGFTILVGLITTGAGLAGMAASISMIDGKARDDSD